MIDENDFVTSLEEIKSDEKPKVAIACPFRVHLEKGKTYLYCTCGHSKN
jgi:hypothetical protein